MRKFKIKKFLLKSFVVLLLFGGVGIWLLVSAIWDIEPPDVSDLIPERVEVADEDNAYTYFQLAADKLYWPEESLGEYSDLNADKIENYPLVEETLRKNKEVLKLIEQGVACKICQFPELESVEKVFETDLNGIIGLKRLLVLKTEYERSHSLIYQMHGTNKLLLKLGVKLFEGKGTNIINTFVASNILTEAMKALRENFAAAEGDQPVRSIAHLPDVTLVENAFIQAFKWESRYFCSCVDFFLSDMKKDFKNEDLQYVQDYKSAFKLGYLFAPNKSKSLNAQLIRAYIRNIKGYVNMGNPVALELRQRCKSGAMLLARPNCVGVVMNMGLGSGSELVPKKSIENKAEITATRLVIYCELYRRKYGALPDSLAQLVPEFISEVPKDPFDGKPMRYSRTKKIIYSVGKNLVDSGGLGEREIKRIKERSHKRNARDVEDLVFYLEPEQI